MPKYTIEEVIPLHKDRQNPILAHFENGEFQPESTANLDTILATDTKNGKRMALTVSKNTVYTGYLNEGFPTDLERTYIGIRDKSTKKIRLIEVDQCSMLSHHYDIPENLVKSTQSDAERKHMLLKNFGGKRAARILERAERMKVNIDVVKDQLNKTVEDVKTLSEIRTDADTEFDRKREYLEEHYKLMTPPLNETAKSISDVYEISKLIDPTLLDRMNAEAVAILSTSPDAIPIKFKYLMDIITTAQQSKEPDSTENLDKMKCCIYIDALGNFLKTIKFKHHKRQLQSFSEITEKVETEIKKIFINTTDNTVIKSKYNEDKLSCYIIILSLLISDKYEVNIDDIVEITRSSRTSITKLIKILPVRLKSDTILTLTLPKISNRNFFIRRRKQ